ncbi:hypothetical protein F2Q70_00029494 [Brassica cretica]|uniref:Uncharacterized protein n=1 Tax=Brassica cretica TaxID=69181 RepID=A0A8S9FB38_BRACR|nr:hypothetical protein F2Q70_00029494 [Brassica cretica]
MSSSFSFPRPTTKTDDLEDLYKVYGVDRAIVLDLAGTTETPETVREGYCGAYLSFFYSCGLNFPIPEPILEILAELGLSFTQILPNFLRYLVAFLVRAREEGLSFGLGEFRHLVLVKRNQQNPGTFLVSLRPGLHVIKDIPYRDEKWREQFFVFKVDRASVGEFDFSRIPRSWAENIAPFRSSLMSDKIRGLIGVLRRGLSNWSSFDQTRIRAAFAMPEGTNRDPLVGGSEDEAEHSQEVIATPSVQAQSSDRLASQLVRRSSFRTSGSASRNRASGRPTLILIHDSDDEDASEERRSPVSLSPSSEDETAAATRKRPLKEVLRVETRLPRVSTQEVKDLEGEKTAARVKSSSPTAAVAKPFHWQFSHSKDCPITEDPNSVAHLVRHFKPAGCPLPSLRNMMEREAYVKMAMAHAKAMEANNEFAATLEKRLQDIPRSDELYELKKVVRELKLGLKTAQDRERANVAQLAAAEKLGNQAASLEARVRVVSNERKSALEKVSFLEAKVESSANKFSDDLRHATYDAKKVLADSYLDVLVSLKEKWEKKKAVTDCEARLREVMANIGLLKEIMNNNLLASDELLRLRTKEVELGSELDVMAILDFSVGKLDLPQISEDLPEDFFAKVPSVANGTDDVMKCSGGQFEDGELGIEE